MDFWSCMFYKALTHDFCPPVRGGEQLFNGTLPFALPPVWLDTGTAECAAGWNFGTDLATVLRIAGLWPDGRPSVVFEVEPRSDAIQRGDKWRSSSLTLLRMLTEDEVREGVRAMSSPFTPHADAIADEQMAWREALARPLRDEAAVEAGLRAALAVRGLSAWGLRRFDTVQAARAAVDARDAWDAGAAWSAWSAWADRADRAARAAWAAGAVGDAWSAWSARDAWAALSVWFAARQGWIRHDAELLTTGLRDAYRNGLLLAIPTAQSELEWVMDDNKTKGHHDLV